MRWPEGTRVGVDGKPVVPAPVVMRTSLQLGEEQKISKTRMTRIEMEGGRKRKEKDRDTRRGPLSTRRGLVGTSESPEQEREFERNVQEKYGGQHESVRPQ